MIKLNSYLLAGLVIVLIFGGIGFSTAMNWWQTESTKVPATFSEGEFAGQYDPADIRGSYSFGDVSSNFSVPLADLATAFRLPVGTDVAVFTVKDLESLNEDLPIEMGTSSVRLFVAFYNGLPFDLSVAEDSYLFPEAAQILTAHGQMQPEQAQFLATHIVSQDMTAVAADESATDESAAAESTPQPEAAATEHVAPAMTVTGATTFQNLLDWGLDPALIESVIGGTMPNAQILVKDYAVNNGQTFSTLKTALQAELDKLK